MTNDNLMEKEETFENDDSSFFETSSSKRIVVSYNKNNKCDIMNVIKEGEE